MARRSLHGRSVYGWENRTRFLIPAHARIATAYGAAGSLIILLLWCYYAAQIVFFGAAFTRVSEQSNGGRDFSFFDNTPLSEET